MTGCSIMTDAWTDTKRSIINLCMHCKLGTCFIGSKESSEDAHKFIFQYVDAAIDQVGVANVVQVVTDNASKNMGAKKLLKDKRPNIFWSSCATHNINLMLQAIGGMTRFKKTLEHAKSFTVFVYSHHKTLALMRKHTKKRDIIRPGVTRFASAFLTLQSLIENKRELRGMALSVEWEQCTHTKKPKGKTAISTLLSRAFWNDVSQCLKVFEPLVKVLRMVDGDGPSMAFIYGKILEAKKEIMVATNNLENTYNPKFEHIVNKMEGPIRAFGKPAAKLGCQKITFIPANWWATYGCHVPHLQKKKAIRILSLTSSSSGCERNWSTFDMVHTKEEK